MPNSANVHIGWTPYKKIATTYLQTSTNVAIENIKSKTFFLPCPRVANPWGASWISTLCCEPFSTSFCEAVILFLSIGGWTSLGPLVKSVGIALSDIASCWSCRVPLGRKSAVMLPVAWSHSAAYILWISMLRKGALAKSNESTTKEPPPNDGARRRGKLTHHFWARGCASNGGSFRSAPPR